MASNLPKSIKVFFNDLIKTFNNNNMTAMLVGKYKMPQMEGEQSSNAVWRPIDDISASSEGRTISAFTDVTALSVPSVLNSNLASPSDFINSTFKLNANDLNDPSSRKRKLDGVIRELSSQVDRKITTKIANEGAIFIKESAALTSYAQLNQCEAEMSIRGVDIASPRSMMLEPFVSNAIANELQGRGAPPTGVSLTALERSRLPMIGGFDTFKTNILPNIVAAAGTSYVVDTAQKHIPLGNDKGTVNAKPVDNRSFEFKVETGTGTIKIGDAFTIADVFGVNMQTKQSTGKLQTFRVIRIVSGAGVGTTTLEITPALIAFDGGTQEEKEYANCTTSAADGKAIVFLNTVTKAASIFWVNDAVEITHGSLSGIDMAESGLAVLRDTTDSGIEVILLKSSDILTLDTKYRLTIWMAPNILIPQKAGVILGSQT